MGTSGNVKLLLPPRQSRGDSLGGLDRYLGRVELAGGNIQRKTTELLSGPHSRPNSLHESLIDIFSGPGTFRIVTTNFDHHFETVIQARGWSDEVEIFRAPALPYGDKFSGLVYLHGRLESPGRLVLTDQDFGEAYLTRGWARRFLQELFLSFTVLFVGYSHQDVVVNYLARGLPPGNRHRYALIDSTHDLGRWRYLGIEPFTYEFDAPHSKLPVFLGAWVKHSQEGALEREVQIRQIVDSGPQTLAIADRDYLLYSLNNPVWAQYFFRYAKPVEWLRWANENKVLESLFAPQGEGRRTGVDNLADWFSEDPLSERGREAFQIAALYNKPLQLGLWRTLAHRIWVALKEGGNRSVETSQLCALWLSTLIRQEPTGANWDMMTYWLEELLIPQERGVLLELLRALTMPRITASTGFMPEMPLRYELSIRGYGYLLERFRGDLQSDLSHLSEELLWMCIQNLEQAHRTLGLVEGARGRWDPLSFHVQRVGEHSDSSTRAEPILALVDLAWLAIGWLADNKPDFLLHLLFATAESPSLLVRRICIAGIARLPNLTCEEKARLVISRLWLEYPFKPETFKLLARCYPQLSIESREEFLDAADNLYRGKDEEQQEEDPEANEFASYNMYNLLEWLAQADRECELIQSRIATIKSEHPNYSPREHLDLDHWMSGAHSVATISPYSADDILKWSADLYFKSLEEVIEGKKGQHESFEDPVQGFLEETAESVSREPEKGLELALELANRKSWSSSVWTFIFRGWSKATTNEGVWNSIMSLLQENADLLCADEGYHVAELLEDKAKSRQPTLSPAMIERGITIALLLLPCTSDDVSEELEGGWLQTAVNRPSGKLADFAVHSLDILWNEAGRPQDWSIPESLRTLLEKLINDFPYSRTVLAGYLHFLLGVASSWTKDSLIPLFSWSRDPKSAIQVWSGFLDWGRVTSLVREHLLPSLKETFSSIDSLPAHQRQRLSEYVAWFAYNDDKDPVAWLREFLASSSDEDRAVFARQIASFLDDIKSEQREELWSSWLSSYFCLRMDGPPSIEDSEKLAFIRWCEELPEKLSELVTALVTLPPPSIEIHQLYRLLQDEDDKRALPATEDLGRLLLWILQGQRKEQFYGYYCEQARKALERLKGKIEQNLYRKLVERYSELGCPGAPELLA